MSTPQVPRRLRKLGRHLAKLGWTYKPSGKGHPRWFPPEGWTTSDGSPARPIGFSLTPSDFRADRNSQPELRRQGIDWTF